MASTWGNNTWGSNEWSDDTVTINPTGQLATSSTGSLEAFNEEGWGRQEWGNSGWGVEYAVSLLISEPSSFGIINGTSLLYFSKKRAHSSITTAFSKTCFS